MKSIKVISIAIIVIFALLISSCDKTGLYPDNQIADILGTYTGTIVNDNNPGNLTDATAVVTMGSDLNLQIHCYSENFDTTIMLDTYHNDDMIMVCNTGQDFYNEYGHHQSENSNNCNEMMGSDNGMMGDWDNSSCEWDEHINNDHTPGDMHFGGFNMSDHSFSYDFKMQSDGSTFFNKFRGKKVK